MGAIARVLAQAGALATLGIAAACAQGEEQPSLDFTVMYRDRVAAEPEPRVRSQGLAIVDPASGTVRVRGVISLPDHCDSVRASLAKEDGAELRLVVRAQDFGAEAGNCDASRHTLVAEYGAEIGRLAPGDYRLRVLHDYERAQAEAGAGGSIQRTVLDTVVQLR